MGLKTLEQEELAKALLNYYPSREALAQMARHELDEDLNKITPQNADLVETVSELVKWADSQDRTAELIHASRQWNPQSPALQEFVDSLSRSTKRDEKTVPPSAPAISTSLRQTFISAMLLIPEIKDFKIRSQLLVGIPWMSTLPRQPDNPLDDLSAMINQLDASGQLKSGAWPLVILADNARALAEGTQAEQPLEKVYKRLLDFYKSKLDKATF